MHKFPDGFLWGTATAAHQIEGNNTNSDWWQWEQSKASEPGRVWPLEPSGLACDSYNRYEEDFDLCAQLNNTAVRISIEWARIEPEEGKFDQQALEHYKKVLSAARSRGLKTFVTLHHFTNPLWFAKKGSWESMQAPKYFARYAKKCAEELDDLIDFYMTINEPQVYAMLAYKGLYDYMQNAQVGWPPVKKNYIRAFWVQTSFGRAHKAAYKAIKKVRPHAQVGIVENIAWWESTPNESTFIDDIACKIITFIDRDLFLLPIKKYIDFIGLNYYFTNRIKHLKWNNPSDYGSDLGWWINPNGLEKVLENLASYKVPVYITENGLADAGDRLRTHFIRDHLAACARAIEKGVDVKGYFHWSLLDNYEWHQGFWPRFGLVEIDRENNLARKPRPSFYYYADICKNNSVDL